MSYKSEINQWLRYCKYGNIFFSGYYLYKWVMGFEIFTNQRHVLYIGNIYSAKKHQPMLYIYI
jgi:hypothetical protein